MKAFYFAIATILIVGFTSSVHGLDEPTPPPPTPSPDFDCPDLEDSYHPHQSDCTKFYHCTNGLAWLQQCAHGLYFNPAIVQCDWPQNVDCPHDKSLKVKHQVSKPKLNFSTKEIVGPAPWYECPEENGAYPHEEDCDKYYDCYNKEAHLGQCTNNMLFDIKYSGCNWAVDVDCGHLNRPTNVPPTTPRTTTTTRQPGEPFECPEEQGLFPNPKNCASFYMCHGGEAWQFVCSSPLLYNIEAQYCDHAINVDCGERPIPSQA